MKVIHLCSTEWRRDDVFCGKLASPQTVCGVIELFIGKSYLPMNLFDSDYFLSPLVAWQLVQSKYYEVQVNLL